MIHFIAILMQEPSNAWQISIDPADIGCVTTETGDRRGDRRDTKEQARHRRPALAGVRIGAVVAIAAAVRKPADRAAVRQSQPTCGSRRG